MKQITLTVEQMEHLEDLGLDTSDASMFYHEIDEYTLPRLVVSEEVFKHENLLRPAYTLQDIIERLPKKLPLKSKAGCNYFLEICRGECIYNAGYADYYDVPEKDLVGIEYLGQQREDDIMTACYKLLCWCVENGYIENNIEK